MAGISRFNAGIDSRPGKVTEITLASGETITFETFGSRRSKRFITNLPPGAKLRTRKKPLTFKG